MSNIRFLSRHEIDESRWNDLIESSTISLPYAFSWYLDVVAENWAALVMDNYRAVLPLVWLRRLGIKCLYQPYYCQQLGFFSAESLYRAEMMGLLYSAAKKFPYININLNPEAGLIENDAPLGVKKNLLLDLSREYPKIAKGYSENHRRNIGKAEKAGLAFSEEVELKAFRKFYLENVNRNKENFKAKHERIFLKLSKVLLTGGYAKIFATVNSGGNLFAAVLLIFHQNRLIGIINTSSEAGKKNGSSHFVFDRLIQKFSGQELVLDFEGSSIPSIARFYEGFGAETEIFYNYRYTIVKDAGRLLGKQIAN